MTSQELDKIEAAANDHGNPAMKRTLLRLVTECRTLKTNLEANKKKKVEELTTCRTVLERDLAVERERLSKVRKQRDYLVNESKVHDRIHDTLLVYLKGKDEYTKRHTQAKQALEHELAELKRHHTADQETIGALRSHNKFLEERVADLERGKKKKCKAEPAVQNAPWITPLVFPVLNTSTTTTMDNVSGVVQYSGTESGRLKLQAVLACGYFS